VSAGTLVYQNTYASAAHAVSSGAILELNVASGSRNAATTTFSGAGTLRKTGAGEIVWNGAGTFALGSGSLIDVRAGTFIGGSGANEVWTNNRSDLNVESGATFSTVEANVRVNKITGTGTIRTGYTGSGYANLAIGVDNGGSIFAGIIADASAEGHLVKEGSGVITLSGASTFTGTTTVNAGGLKLTNNLSLQSSAFNTASAGTLDLTDAAINNLTLGGLVGDAVTGQNLVLPTNVTSLTLNPSANRSRTYLRDISGGAAGLGLTKSGAGTQVLGGTNTYAGVTTFSAGVLNVTSLTDYGVAGPLGQRDAGSEAFGNIGLRFMGGTLQYTGATAQSTNRQIRIGTGGGTIDASGSIPGATVTFAYSGTNTDLFDTGGARTLTLTGTNTGANTFSLGLTDQNASTGKTALTKTGAGTWVLTGTQAYTGATTITAGTLNLATSIAGSATTINGASSVLTGLGTAGAVTLTAGSLRPGDGSATGILTTGSLTIAAGQSLGFTLGTPGTSSRVAAASLTLPATGAPLRITLTDNADAGGNGRLTPGTYSLLTYSGALTGGNAVFGRTLTVAASPLTNKSYSFANTGAANGAVNVTISAQSPVLLQDTFDRTSLLGGTSPSVAASSAAGATWTSAAGITTAARAASFTTANSESATLPFLPQAGNVYTLSASLNAAGGTASNWLALGFANSTPPTATPNNGNTLAWILQRNNNTAGQSFYGGGTGNGANHSISVGGVEQTNTIVLDTRNGLANATLHFLVNGVAQRTAVTGFDAGAIANVIIGNNASGGTLKDLALTAGSTWLPAVGINSWDNAANWSAGYRPGTAETIAVFAPFLGTVGQTISLDADQTVGQLAFVNSVAGGGSFTISQGAAGTLTLDNGSAGASIRSAYGDNRISAPVLLNDALTVEVASGSSVELSGAIGQTGGARGLTKNGNGVLTLSGANTYAGPTTVNAGTLRLNHAGSTHAASVLAVNAGATLDVRSSVTVDSLSFVGAATANISASGTSARLLTANTLTTDPNGSVTVNIVGATPGSWASGTYPLFAYGSLTGAGFAGFQLGIVDGTTNRMLSKTLVDAGNAISLVVVNDTPKWTGAVASDLDANVGDWLNDTGNWKLATSLAVTDFLSGDAVIFDDTATGVTSVNIDFPVSPSAVLFDNSAKLYVLDSLSGFGIGGSSSLTKRGTGRL
jgi:autotransporter-associated beta strand protein